MLVLNDPLDRRALVRAIHEADGDAGSDFVDLNLDLDLDESVDLRYPVDVGAHVAAAAGAARVVPTAVLLATGRWRTKREAGPRDYVTSVNALSP